MFIEMHAIVHYWLRLSREAKSCWPVLKNTDVMLPVSRQSIDSVYIKLQSSRNKSNDVDKQILLRYLSSVMSCHPALWSLTSSDSGLDKLLLHFEEESTVVQP